MKKKNLLMTAVVVFGLATISIAQTVPSYVPTSGLVGWWPFTGNANDLSVNANNGTLVGGTILTTDRFGSLNSAYAFDGNGDYIDCGNAPSVNITGSLSISAWFYSLDYSNQRGILTKSPLPPIDDGYQLVVGALVPLDITFLNTNCGYTAPTLTWVHVATVFDSVAQTVKQYTNGILDTTITVLFNVIGTSPDNLCLGTHRPTFTTDWSWSGTLDDIGIWNRALTSTEITALFNSSNVGINEVSQSNLFSVYPNPAKSQINLKADAKLLGSVFSIYDNTGKLVLSGKINSENTVIELGNLSGGIYLFSVGENLKQTFKVIKE
jgi:hypothetical protein